jgi:outer membrane protein
MKIFLPKIVLGLLVAAIATGSALGQGRIATIDLNKAFSNYWKKKEAEATLKDQQADMEKEYKTYVDDVKKAKTDYQKALDDSNDPAVSSDERDKRRKVADDRYKAMKDAEERAVAYNKQAMTTLDERSRRVRESILKEIQNVINAKSKAAGYSLVIDTAAETRNFTPVVLYNNNELDITDAVLDQLNAAAPTAAASSSSGGNKADEKKKDAKKDKGK